VDELLDQKAEIENKLKQVIGDNVGIQTEKYRVTWKAQATAPKVLFDQMKADGVYDKYTQRNMTRILRVRCNQPEGVEHDTQRTGSGKKG
jgi:predicted phage-related endonuclease